MLAPPSITSKNDIKSFEYKQDDTTFKIEINTNLDNAYFCIKNISKINLFYELEISFNDIKKKNQVFRIYQSAQEFCNALEGFIKNKNISIQENKENLTLNIIVFNMMNGNKENISFILNRKINNNKDEIIKFLCEKVNHLEEKMEEMNKNYIKLKEIVDGMNKKEEPFSFVWENNSNCQLLNGNKKIKKIRGGNDWNTGVKGNNLLKKNFVNVFKIKVNHINKDKSGLQFGIVKKSSFVSVGTDWNLRCDNTNDYKYTSFSSEQINEGDIMSFIVDLRVGTLELKKNDVSLGKLNNLPTNEDLVPSVSIYFVDDEVEIID